MKICEDYEVKSAELVKLDSYPALVKSDNFAEIKKHAKSLKADFLVWYGGYWVAYKKAEIDPRILDSFIANLEVTEKYYLDVLRNHEVFMSSRAIRSLCSLVNSASVLRLYANQQRAQHRLQSDKSGPGTGPEVTPSK